MIQKCIDRDWTHWRRAQSARALMCPFAAWVSQVLRSDMLVYIRTALRYSWKGMVSVGA